MSQTTNYNLDKPAGTDQALISVINGNMDKIDAQMKRNADAAADAEGGQVIPVSGDTASRAISEGQYIFLKGHSSLPTGGYHATADIANGDTISNSNVTIDADGSLNDAVEKITNTMRDVPFAVAVSDWSAVTGGYSATFSSAYVTASCKWELIYDSSLENAQAHIIADIVSGGGGITFTSEKKPTGTVTGIIRIVDTDDGKVPVIIEDTVVGLANGGTGQSSLAGAQQVLGITALNNNLANLLKPSAYTAPTSIHANATLVQGGYVRVGNMIVVNCRLTINTAISATTTIAKFPGYTKTGIYYSHVALANNKLIDLGIDQGGDLRSPVQVTTGTLVISGVYFAFS